MRAAQILRRLIGPLELIHAEAGPELLRATQLGIFGLWIVKILLDPLWRLAELPHELLVPAGLIAIMPPNLVDSLFTVRGLETIWACSLFATALCLSRRIFPVASLIASVLLTLYSSLIRSFGPAVHTDIVLLLAVYALSLFSWADYFSARQGKRSPEHSSYPLITIVSLLCLSYFLVGLSRVLVGGLGVFTGDSMEIWTVDASLRAYYFNTNIGWHIPEWRTTLFMLRAGLPVITLFEITAPLCLAWPRYRWVFIPTMLSFHLLSLLLMNIFFFDDMFLYLLLIDWSRRFPFFDQPRRPF
jgi:hypothetical protein